MTRPAWVTAVGVLGIIFGCTGILGGSQQMMMPKMLALQKQMFADFSADLARAQKNSNCRNDSAAPNLSSDSSAVAAPKVPCQASPFPGPPFPAVFQELWNFPPWFATWVVITGALRTLIGAFYLFSAIWFIQMKRSSVWLFSGALSLNILLGLAQLGANFFAASIMIAVMMAGSSFGMVFDVVMLTVIWMSDRSAFKPRRATIDSPPATL